MTQKQGELLLASVIIARSTSYLLMKLGLSGMAPLTMLALRFLLAFVVLAVVFHERMRRIRLATLWRGALLGGVFFAVMSAQIYALTTTSASATSFLESTAIVFVPVLDALLKRKLPGRTVWISTGLAILGVALLTFKPQGFAMARGEWLCLLSALLYAIAILLTARLSREEDPLLLGILQVGFMGLLDLIGAFLFETPRLPQGGGEWGIILSLALVCSAFGFTFQPVAQSHTTAARAGLFCALTPLCAAIMGAVFLQEKMSVVGLVGAALILAGVIYASVQPARAQAAEAQPELPQ